MLQVLSLSHRLEETGDGAEEPKPTKLQEQHQTINRSRVAERKFMDHGATWKKNVDHGGPRENVHRKLSLWTTLAEILVATATSYRKRLPTTYPSQVMKQVAGKYSSHKGVSFTLLFFFVRARTCALKLRKTQNTARHALGHDGTVGGGSPMPRSVDVHTHARTHTHTHTNR